MTNSTDRLSAECSADSRHVSARRTPRRLWLSMAVASSSLALMVAVKPAFAQTKPDASSSTATADGSRQSEDGDRDNDILVTAQKRSESIREVPVSVSVISGSKLEGQGATGIVDYAAYVPGLNIESLGTPGQVSITLRGVPPLGSSASVGTYVDDSPLGTSSLYGRGSEFSLDLFPYDIDRVEILRGPQGTLYGASTVGGLLKYALRKPDLSETEIRAGGEVFGIVGAAKAGWSVRGSANLPIVSDTLAVRGSYFRTRTPGFIDNPQTGVRDENALQQSGGRVALRWRPVANFTADLSAMWQTITARNDSVVSLDPITMRPRFGDLTDAHVLDRTFSKDLAFYGATLTWDAGWATLTSASSYAKTKTGQGEDTTLLYEPLLPILTGGAITTGRTRGTLDLDLEKFTQEVRLAGPSGKTIEWLIGGFYTYEKSRNLQADRLFTVSGTEVPGFSPLGAASLPSTYREVAIFGDVTYRFTDRFDVSGGLRWARNTQRFHQISSGLLNGGVVDLSGRSAESVFNYSFSPRFKVNRDVMIYSRIASGYRPGGPNVVVPGVPPAVDADTLVNYEVGLKSEFFHRRVLFDVAIFHIDWKNIQITDGNGLVSWLANGGRAKSQGIELTTSYTPVRGLRIGVNGAYTDAELKDDVPALGGRAGDDLPQVPHWNASATIDYEATFGRGWLARVGAGYRRVGSSFTSFPDRDNQLPLDGYGAADLNMSLSNSRWTLRVFAKNLFDARPYIAKTLLREVDLTGGQGQPLVVKAAVLQPRTIGVSFDVTF